VGRAVGFHRRGRGIRASLVRDSTGWRTNAQSRPDGGHIARRTPTSLPEILRHEPEDVVRRAAIA